MSIPDPLDSLVEPEPHHPHGDAHDPVHDELESRVDPAVAEAVHSVRDRFGASGLRDLISLAGYELDIVQQALASLRTEVVEAPPSTEDAAFGSLLAADESGPDDAGGAGSR